MRCMRTADGKTRGWARLAAALLLTAALALAGCADRVNKALLRKQADASRNLAEAYSAEGKFRMALRELQKAEVQDPENADIQYDLGLVYLALKQPELAIAPFKRSLEIQPDYVVAMNSLGATYMALERWDEAIPWFEKILTNLLYATPQFPYLNLGYCYYNKKNYDRSVEAYRTALEFDPNFVEAWRGLGRTYTAMGRVDEAVGALEKALTLAPKFPNAYYDLAQAYIQKGQRTKALEALNKVMALAPGTSLAADASQQIQKLR